MLVLGVDPGSRTTGWGLVTRHRGGYKHLASGAIHATVTEGLANRVLFIHRGVSEVISRYQPDVVAVEAIFHHRSADSALKLGHARGVVLLAAAEAGLSIYEYAPAHIKKAVSGYGRADKAQVARMVEMLLGETMTGTFDITDALAVAITHLAHGPAGNMRVVEPGPAGTGGGC